MSKVLVVWIAMVFLACTSPSEIGVNFVNREMVDINFSDSLSLQLSTVIYDSMITSNASRLLVGYHQDEYLGKIKSTAVFQLSPQSSLLLDENSVFDQLVLHIKLDGYSYYDTLNSMKLDVYQLRDDLESSDGYYYNTTSYTIGNSVLGSIDFIPEPNHMDSLDIPLSSTLGSELFKLALVDDQSVTEEFTDYFKGIAIVPDDGRQSCFIGISKDITLRMYYYDYFTIPAVRKYIDFPMASVYFNHIQSDLSETSLSSLITHEIDLPSSQTDHLSFIQAGVGIYVKVNIPYLREFGYLSNNLAIVKAELKLIPVDYFSGVNTLPPSSLNAYLVNSTNEIQSQLSVTASLYGDGLLERTQYYTLDVTDFVLNRINNYDGINYSLLLMPDQDVLSSSVSKVFLGDSQSGFRAELKIYYLEIN